MKSIEWNFADVSIMFEPSPGLLSFNSYLLYGKHVKCYNFKIVGRTIHKCMLQTTLIRELFSIIFGFFDFHTIYSDDCMILRIIFLKILKIGFFSWHEHILNTQNILLLFTVENFFDWLVRRILWSIFLKHMCTLIRFYWKRTKIPNELQWKIVLITSIHMKLFFYR